jgi:hypothetical protein
MSVQKSRLKKEQVAMMSYYHPNHKTHCINQPTYQPHHHHAQRNSCLTFSLIKAVIKEVQFKN